MADLPPLLKPSAHNLRRHNSPSVGILPYCPGDPDLSLIIDLVANLAPDQYYELHFMAPSESPSGDVVPMQELGRLRARKVAAHQIEVATAAFLLAHSVGFSIEFSIHKAVNALRTRAATSGWEVVYVGEFLE